MTAPSREVNNVPFMSHFLFLPRTVFYKLIKNWCMSFGTYRYISTVFTCLFVHWQQLTVYKLGFPLSVNGREKVSLVDNIKWNKMILEDSDFLLFSKIIHSTPNDTWRKFHTYRGLTNSYPKSERYTTQLAWFIDFWPSRPPLPKVSIAKTWKSPQLLDILSLNFNCRTSANSEVWRGFGGAI